MDEGRADARPEVLCDSVACYNTELGKWWKAQAENSCHTFAYRKIAGFVRASFRRPPKLIVDYACGAGHLLTRLSLVFPGARLIGLDASSFLLDLARKRLARLGPRVLRRTILIETMLPDVEGRRREADLVIYAFPNMLPSRRGAVESLYRRCLAGADHSAGGALSRPTNPEEELEDPEALRRSLLLGRLVSLDLHALLRRGGICIRVEYAAVPRHELPRSELMRVSFEEGSLDMAVDGAFPMQWFRVAASSFFRSHVVEDVYQQSGDPSDKHGGYVITVLRAV